MKPTFLFPNPATRLSELPQYAFSLVAEQIRELERNGDRIIRLDMGNPDLPPPDHVLEALSHSARQPGNHGYSGYRGTPAFRQAVADYYKERFHASVRPDSHVLPLMGSKEGIVNLSLAMVDKGDIVIVPDIGYPSYAMGARLAGAEIFWWQLKPENGFAGQIEDIPDDVAHRAKLLWLNYPNNPTGTTVDKEYFVRIVEFCRRNSILLASDNPYVDVTFDGYIAPSILEVDDDLTGIIEFMSLSKTYNMAGWRLGAAVGDSHAINTLLRVKSNMDSGHFIAIYDAGVAALKTDTTWVADRNALYERRRDIIISALPEIGLRAETPRATLYIWASLINHEAMTAEDYVSEARQVARVSMASGSVYGPGGESFIRISLSVPDEDLLLAINRLKDWYQR